MSTVKIVTDSSVRIAPHLLEDLGIVVVPLSVLVDGVIYADTDLAEGQFLELMRTTSHLPKTSQPPVGLFADTYTDLAKDGSRIVSIHLSHALSGTVEAARQGAQLSGVDVVVVDSAFTDQAAAFQVLEAARMAQAGVSPEEIVEQLVAIREKTALYIGLSTLDNLVKGGRMGRVMGFLGSLLHVRLVMEMKDHRLFPVAKGRGHKTFKKWVTDLAARLQTESVAEVAISYAGSREFAESIRTQLQPLVAGEIVLLETSSVIQTHTGEGAWAILIRYE